MVGSDRKTFRSYLMLTLSRNDGSLSLETPLITAIRMAKNGYLYHPSPLGRALIKTHLALELLDRLEESDSGPLLRLDDGTTAPIMPNED